MIRGEGEENSPLSKELNAGLDPGLWNHDLPSTLGS